MFLMQLLRWHALGKDAKSKSFSEVLRASERSMNAMFSRNVRYGLRQLVRNRVFAVVAILNLALGIGMTASMFSVVYAVLVRPLPFTNAEQVVLIGQATSENRAGPSS